MEANPNSKSETQVDAASDWRSTTPRVPDHELVRRIGEGSYGEVWLARNTVGTLRAVKLVYGSRFKDQRPYEREFSGIQKYEPISRSNEGLVDVLQIGRNDAEHYFYYVMELADDAGLGRPEHQFAGQHSRPEDYVPKTLAQQIRWRGRLTVEECITLGLSLNLALGHLHRHGLIHRDVKPSNIIFVNGVPKLADIGLVTELAEAQSFVGTEGFIPPEGPNSPLADIYALGKVLYEACMAKDRREFPEPFSNLGSDAESRALMELNAVLLKACAPSPKQRYRSAEDMNADLALLHSGKSVQHKQRLEKRLKIVTRVGIGLAATLLLAAFPYYLAITEAKAAKAAAKKEAQQHAIALANETKAQAEAAKSKQVAQFLKDTLQGVGPSVALGRDTTILKEILDKTAATLQTNFVNQPDVEAELRGILGGVYYDLGQADKAEAMFRVKLQLLERVGQSASEPYIRCEVSLVQSLLAASRLAEAERVARDALEKSEHGLVTNADVKASALDCMGQLALLQDRYEEAEAWMRRALETEEAAHALAGDLVSPLNDLATVLHQEGKLAEAETLQRRVVAILKDLGREDPDTARAIDNLSKVLQARGNPEEAESLMRDALRIRRKVLPDGHGDIALGLHNLADILMDLKRFDEAEKLLVEAVDIRKKQNCAPMALATSLNTLGAVRQDLNKLPEAEAALREALQVRRDSLPPQHPEIANSLNNMVNILRRQDKTNDVEAFAREALAIREKQIPDNWRTFNSKAVLGLVLYDQGRYADAESYMLAGYEGLRQRLPQMHSNAKGRCLEAAEHLVLLYQATGKEEQARRWKSTVAEITREIEPLPGAK